MPYARGAHSHEKGVRECVALKNPFQVSPVIHKTPSWGTSPFTRPLLKEKCDISPPKSNIFRKYVNFQLEKLKFARNFHQKAWKFCKILVLKPIFFDEILTEPQATFTGIYWLTSPQVWKSRPHIPTRKNKTKQVCAPHPEAMCIYIHFFLLVPQGSPCAIIGMGGLPTHSVYWPWENEERTQRRKSKKEKSET